MTYSFKNIFRLSSLSIIALAVLLVGVRPASALSEVPVKDEELIKVANDILEEVTKTSEEQQRATANQIFAWRTSYQDADLKKEIVDLFSEKIIGYVQRPGVSFVENWRSYLENAAYQGAKQEIRRIRAGRDFCFKERILAIIERSIDNPDDLAEAETVDRPDDDCTLDNANGTSLQSFKDGGLSGVGVNGSGGFSAARSASSPHKNFVTLLTHYQERVDSAAVISQRAAENEALSGGGFLSTKESGTRPDDPSALITTPGSILQGIAQDAIIADLTFIAGQGRVTKDLLASIGDSFIVKLTDEDTNGLAGLDVCAHLKSRVARSNQSKQSDRGDRQSAALEDEDCSLLLRGAGTLSEGNAATVNDGKTDNLPPDNNNTLVAKINSLLATRTAADTIFKQKIRAATERYDRFNTGSATAPLLDPARKCSPTRYGRPIRRGEPTQGQVNRNNLLMPAGASEEATGQQSFTRANGTNGWRACMTQAQFDTYGAGLDKLALDRSVNRDAIKTLTAFRRDAKSLVKTDPDFEAQLAEKLAEFNTLGLKSSDSTPKCESSLSDSPNHYEPNTGSYDASSNSWEPPCYEYAFDGADATQTKSAIDAVEVSDLDEE